MSSSNRSDNSDNKLSHRVVSDAELEFSHWQLPDVTEAEDDTISNLFGYSAQQVPKAAVIETISPPTMAEIEDIRAQAEAEGFDEGKTQGYSEGLEQGRLEGLEQGHKEGFSQGHEQGLEAGLAEAKSLLCRFEELLSQFEKPLQLLDGDIEHSLMTLTMALAKSVIGHELKTHPEQILSALRLGVESLPIKEQSVNLRMHPDDVALVETLYSSTQLNRNQWQLEADPSLTVGDCIISSQRSLVDLTLSSRIDAVFESLRNQQSHLALQQQQRQAALDDENAAKIVPKSTLDDNELLTQPQADGEQDAQSPPSTAE
ncbi:flagellar assembly protein FliH [Shewanella xiamenensis]|uniref:Flagellar assembly protein FliH n=1 Tax=Shewanella xiamenensis TaxID=332186 RepID=A0ABT6UCI3_9GAMM|nr:flagellar assembly protein FliH [Shewanella xiamenensis]MDI5831191.1 flagellar assembly protein FliH [Shewanella xiamenensis]TVL33406.1 flagellar assembly protein FliH [Shewanella xiamenensis]UML94998.1 flagellar assembly protein FliH [Shewanella xiamenensis]